MYDSDSDDHLQNELNLLSKLQSKLQKKRYAIHFKFIKVWVPCHSGCH